MVVKLSSVFQQLFEYSRGFRALREVADFGLEGFPTRPIRGSRGILRVDAGI